MNTQSASLFDRLSLEQAVHLQRTFSPEQVAQWCRLAGVERWPDEVPEPLIAGLFSCLLGMELPGPGTMYLKQRLDYVQPARLGELLTASVTITQLRPDKSLVDLDTLCTGATGQVICRGQALVLFRR